MSSSYIFSPLSLEKCSTLILKQLSITCCANFSTVTSSSPKDGDEEEFRVLNIRGKKAAEGPLKKYTQRLEHPPRADKMPIDQDWTNVWPGPRTFHPASVPLPIRQGLNNLGPAPNKYANVELMKIPNFLHLTPPAIKKHCEALKKFCTPWPEALSTDEDCKKHFPLEVIQTDYCHASPSIRNPLSRIVTIKFPLSRLELDEHAKDKFLRLVGERYDEETDTVTIVTDKCPLKIQNYDYALYLLTALYFESWTYEPWEKEKLQQDFEYFDWETSKSKQSVKYLFTASSRDFIEDSEDVTAYKNAVKALFDEGENDYNLEKYKEAALKILRPTT